MSVFADMSETVYRTLPGLEIVKTAKIEQFETSCTYMVFDYCKQVGIIRVTYRALYSPAN